MLKEPRELLRELEGKMEEMRQSVFVRPPSDWAQFQHLCGKYAALFEMRTSLLEGINEEGDSR